MEEFTDSKAWIKTLSAGCPLGEPRADCPVEKLRKMTVMDMLLTVEMMSEEERLALISYHRKCSADRQREIF